MKVEHHVLQPVGRAKGAGSHSQKEASMSSSPTIGTANTLLTKPVWVSNYKTVEVISRFRHAICVQQSILFLRQRERERKREKEREREKGRER